MNAVTNELEAGSKILWYQIRSVLGRGGFGITYLAKDTNLGQLVAIKEYLPHNFATRNENSSVRPNSVEQDAIYNWGLDRFMNEAKILAKFRHTNIVHVLSVFKHNNTGYMVMDYERGKDLSALYKEKRQLDQTELENIYYPIIEGLQLVHNEKFIHRDIKPENIFIRNDGSPVLLDFGAARLAVDSKTKQLTAMLSVGYAPIEQYNDMPGKQGPWTDIYAMGASMYKGIKGKKPPESTIRGMAFLHHEPDPYEPLCQSNYEDYSYSFLRAIDQSLMMQITDRPQSLKDFLAMLRGEVSLQELPQIKPVSKQSDIIEKTVIMSNDHVFSALENSPSNDDHDLQKTVVNIFENFKPDIPQHSASTDRHGHSNKLTIVGSLIVLAVIGFMFFSFEKTPEEIKKLHITPLIQKAGEFVASFPGLKEAQAMLTDYLAKDKKSSQLDILISNAKAALINNHIYEPEKNSALAHLKRIIKLDPGNPFAVEEIETIANLVISDAKQALKKKKYRKATMLASLAESLQPDNQEISRISDQIAYVSKLENLISKADRAYAKHQYTSPKNNNAVDLYKQILKISPANRHAAERLDSISEYYENKIRTPIHSGSIVTANDLFNDIESSLPDYPGLENLKSDSTPIQQEQNSTFAKDENARKHQQIFNSIHHLIPVSINQDQDDSDVVQDIVLEFQQYFQSRDIQGLYKVAQIKIQDKDFYTSLFSSYNKIKLNIVPRSFHLSRHKGIATVSLQITDLKDLLGNPVESTEGWGKINLRVMKKAGYWLKVEITE